MHHHDHRCEMYPTEDTWDRIYEAIDEGQPPPWEPTRLHIARQDTTLPVWNDLLQLIEDAAGDRREVFAPRRELGADRWAEVVTLPTSIALLKNVRKLDLYRSSLLVIPPEIGAMERLEEFVPYNSYGLHWFPYEITRCKFLRSSTVSTRALYGNYKYRPPFPSLEPIAREFISPSCSVCATGLSGREPTQVWISLRVATDVLPLLVNACSAACLKMLPVPAAGYVQCAHTGGPHVAQPPAAAG